MKTGEVIILAAVGAILGAVADHFFEVPVKAAARKFWGKVFVVNPSTTAGVAPPRFAPRKGGTK